MLNKWVAPELVSGIEESCETIAKAIRETGPYDGVMTFS